MRHAHAESAADPPVRTARDPRVQLTPVFLDRDPRCVRETEPLLDRIERDVRTGTASISDPVVVARVACAVLSRTLFVVSGGDDEWPHELVSYGDDGVYDGAGDAADLRW